MQTTKRARNNSVRNYDDKKRRAKIIKTVDTNCLLKGSFTHFEDLSNELIYEIFEFLDLFHAYQSFFNLNTRFREIFTCSNFPIKTNISLISKSNLERYYTDIILPYAHRVTSLCITYRFSFGLDIFAHYTLSQFTRLETLIIENVNYEYVRNVLNEIASLFNLSSLVIIPDDHAFDDNQFLLRIFRLPALKYCKVSSPVSWEYTLLPFATNEYSSIEKLVIEGPISHKYLIRLLSYVPQLRCLSLDYYKTLADNEINHPITLNYLTHLYLKLQSLSFNDFELLMKSFFGATQVLHVSIADGDEYINANRWEQLISSSMPFLRVFDVYIDSHNHLSYISRFDEFSSPFWLEREWFFAHQDFSAFNCHETSFYSMNPYRRKEYTFIWQMTRLAHLKYQKNNFDSVRHVRVLNEQALENSVYYFRNATELTVQNISSEKSVWLIINLKKIIPLQNLNKLDITSQTYSFGKLIKLLTVTPNLTTLNINRIIVNLKNIDAIENNKTFQTVSNRNIITKVTVTQINHLEEVELLLILCPRLEHITINKCQKRTASIVRLISSKDNDVAQHLVSLYILIDDQNYLDRLNTLFRSGKLLNDCVMKIEDNWLSLWR